MKRFLLYLLSSVLLWPSVVPAAPSEADWKKVQALMEKQLPKSALEALAPMEAAAVAEKAWPEAARVIGARIALEASLEEDKPELKLRLADEALAKADPALQPVLQTLVAEWYYGYYEDQRWEIMRRTPGGSGAEVTTWDLPRFLKEIDARFQKALGGAEALKKIPIAQWTGILAPGTLPDTYQPTLYDFVGREALAFYTQAPETGMGGDDEDFPPLDPDSPALGTAEEFLAWKPGAGSPPDLSAIRLYQELMTFHKDDADPGARVLLDLERLQWMSGRISRGVPQPRARAYREALLKKYATHEVSLRIRSLIALALIQEKKPAEALTLLKEGVAAFEKSAFAPRCRNQIREIETPECSTGTELFWNAAGAEIHIIHRNVKRLHFRLYLLEAKPRPDKVMEEMEEEDLEKRLRFLKGKPARSWSVDLPGGDDCLEHETRVTAPADLKPGVYFLASSEDEKFQEKGNVLSGTRLWVTPLALLSRARGNAMDAWVLDAVSGDPVTGAEVALWMEDEKSEKLKKKATLKTGADGFVSFPMKEAGECFLFATRGPDFAAATGDGGGVIDPFSSRGGRLGEAPPADKSTFLFTDRALYRPGQTVRFKGIHALHDTVKNDYRVLPSAKRHVVLKDSNQRELAALDLVTNEYGSFNGSFTLPAGVPGGGFVIEDDDGRTNIRVEEYKRPTFHVEIAPPAASPALGAEVTVKVRASAYTGAPMDGAEVTWNVSRQTDRPARPGFTPGFGPRSRPLAHGRVKAGPDGTAEVKFTALPDKGADEKSGATFLYTVSAAVTDAAGETRETTRTVIAGYTSMRADLSAGDWQTVAAPVEITVHTTTLDGTALPGEGTLTVSRITQPEKVIRHTMDPPVIDGPWQPETWATGELVQKDAVKTGADGTATVPVKLATGIYRAALSAKDAAGKEVTATAVITVVDPAAAKFPARVPFWTGAAEDVAQTGTEYTALWGSGYDRARAFIEVEHRGRIVQRFWTDPGRTQQPVTFKVTPEHQGGFTIHFTQMRENRLYTESRTVDVPWTEKELTLKWEHLTSTLAPGAKETWTLSIAGADKKKVEAEMVAALYDASLDAFAPNGWLEGFRCFYQDTAAEEPEYLAETMDLAEMTHRSLPDPEDGRQTLRHWLPLLPDAALAEDDSKARGTVIGAVAGGMIGGRSASRGRGVGSAGIGRDEAEPYASGGTSMQRKAPGFSMPAGVNQEASWAGASSGPIPSGAVDFSKISARRNLQETAFFYPDLHTEPDGTVKLTFTMPEAVTEWRFLGFAHDKALRSGLLEGKTITARDLMVQPNPPRFLREGDTVEFTVRITNKGEAPQQGMARLNFKDATSQAPADAALGNQTPEQSFTVPGKESRVVSWRVTVPDGQGFLTWKAVAGNDKLTDGEEGWLPVLPRRVLVTESLPLNVREAGEKSFNFKKLTESAAGGSLRHQSLSVQMVSRPAWYAVMALPYLMEYPHECAEQTFNRLYANALARHLAGSDPKIRQVFDIWKTAQPDALKSPLERNADITSLMAEETPWLREAKDESNRRLGILFDANRLENETARLLERLGEMQLEDGSWPWFPGGRGNDFITLYIATGFGRLRHLGVEVEPERALQAMDRMDAWLNREYQQLLKAKNTIGNHLHPLLAFYLYGRSFFLEERPVPAEQKEALDYFLAQARKYWTTLPRMSQAHVALGLLRFGDEKTPGEIVKSLKERSLNDEELGMHWADAEGGWTWSQAPIETQAMMIEALQEIEGNGKAVDDCLVWLLKQKQTQAWPTTKATADAAHALLVGGTGRLASDALVTVSLGGTEVKPEKVEAGTGFYEHKFAPSEIKPDMGTVKVVKTDKGVSWGSVHWQYMEDMAKITPHEGTPLKVTKALFTKVNTPSGPELRPVTGKVKVGDELVIRLELRTDRDMEFVHLKDQRPASVEPVNVLSGYKWQGGLGYYESTKDTASHFFFESLPKGTYVFEYSTRVQLRGKCQAGIAELQCMYAPEYNSHSASAVLEVE